jgi:hypothetical protein
MDMALRPWSMGLIFAAVAQVAAASADDLRLAPDANMSAEVKAAGGHANSASEPIAGSYDFLLEVAGVTPSQPSQERKRSIGHSLRPDPRAAERVTRSTD